jgi:Flp pilus assembly protein protease CpaA
MVWVLVALGSLYISWVDLREHRIYNRDLAILAIFLTLDSHTIALKWSGALLVLALILTCAFRFGGGDFKLFALLLLTQGRIIATSQYVNYLFAALSASLLISTMRHGSLHCTVPLAPAIVLPFLLMYLDI